MSTSHTLAGESRFELEVRKSRHLAHAAPIADALEALEFIHAESDPAAHHNCWAYRAGQDYRFSDDGEPAGTAGRPILAAIEGQGFDQVVVLVTRWFGGIKLGAGGLVRAYGGAAAECLRSATQRPLVRWREAWLDAGFDLSASVHALLQRFGAQKLDETYRSDGLHLHLRVPEAHYAGLAEALAGTSRGQANLRDEPPVPAHDATERR